METVGELHKRLDVAKYTPFIRQLALKQVCTRCILRINLCVELDYYRNRERMNQLMHFHLGPELAAKYDPTLMIYAENFPAHRIVSQSQFASLSARKSDPMAPRQVVMDEENLQQDQDDDGEGEGFQTSKGNEGIGFSLPTQKDEDDSQKGLLVGPILGLHNCCTVCQGILQVIDQEKFVELIKSRVAQSDFEYESFKFNVHSPISSSFRLYHRLTADAKEIEAASEEIYPAEVKQELLQMMKNDQMVELKTVVKWVLAPILAKKLDCSSNLNEDFNILMSFTNEGDDQYLFEPFREMIEEKLNMSNNYKKKKQNLPPHIPRRIGLTHHTMKMMSEKPQFVLKHLGTGSLPLKHDSVFACTLDSKNIYIAGNYLKFTRGLSQTPWEVEGQRIYETSLQEELAKEITPFFGPSDYKFHSGGREDIDVRMLGNGRPFVLQLVNPRKRRTISEEQLKTIEDNINKSKLIGVNNLSFGDEKTFMDLKDSEETKVKVYCCLVETQDAVPEDKLAAVNAIKDLKIDQRTPLRVLHRRSNKGRDKVIHRVHAHPLANNQFLVFVFSSAGTRTQQSHPPTTPANHQLKQPKIERAGTYIKEFIHGDFARTLPNFGLLCGTKADIYQLDVLDLYSEYNQDSVGRFQAMVKDYIADLL